MAEEIKPGLKATIEKVVEEQYTAAHLGSGSAAVLSTPMMIAFMEEASHRAVAPHLPPTQSTVGTVVNIKHLAATPQGMKFRTESELVEVDRRRLKFRVSAYDEKEKIGEGEHERFIIDVDRFAEGLKKKVNE
jgi:fluoroacetyl-CoA thioesterase